MDEFSWIFSNVTELGMTAMDGTHYCQSHPPDCQSVSPVGEEYNQTKLANNRGVWEVIETRLSRGDWFIITCIPEKGVLSRI